MGRLIDADALIETMKKVETEYEDAMTCPSWWTAYSVISEQPTAYDVEKVVEELESLSNAEADYYFAKSNDVIDRETAIDIVRKGGVEW
jgi:organic radical activating enzyme